MSCTIVVGGQYGSEGKGKVVALEALTMRAPLVVRCGGANSGHTVDLGDRRVVLRQIPAGVLNDGAQLFLAAGCVVDPELLLMEADELGIAKDRITVDPRAVIVSAADKSAEAALVPRLASTASGTGFALARRLRRDEDVLLAVDHPALLQRVTVASVAPILHAAMRQAADVIIEGTQGFGLSLLHGTEYPFVTGRDTIASAFASEAGISPRSVDRIVMVVRTFPIRVGGNSGPLDGELTWEDVREKSGAPSTVPEFTSVTKRLRRVAVFDWELAMRARHYNEPTELAVMGLDRLDYSNTGATAIEQISETAINFLQRLKDTLGIPISWVGTGFGTHDAFRITERL